MNGFDAAFVACRRHLLVAAVFSLGLNLLYLAVPIYSLQVYDRILPSGSESTLYLLTLAAAVALAVLAALDALRARVLARAGVRLERQLASRVLDVSIERSLALGPAERGQGLRDLEALRQSLSGQVVLAVFDAPWIPIYLAVLFMIHWLLGVFALLCGAVLLALTMANDRATRGANLRAQETGQVNLALTDAALRNAEAVRAMGMFPGVFENWKRYRIESILARLSAEDRGAIAASGIKFVRLMAQVLMLGAGAWLAIRQQVTPGAIFASAIVMARAIQPVEQIVGLWRHLAAARDAYQRLQALLRRKPAGATPLDLPRPAGDLSIEKVVFIPPGSSRRVLDGISFRLDAGEALAVIGPTAAGKSTLARLLVGVYPSTAGSVRIDGADAFAWSRGSLGKHVGYLPQAFELFPGTVAQNIARFGEVDGDAVVAAARLAGVHEIVLGLPRGYETPVGVHDAAISGGQRQLIALARAVFGSPRLVVLDEPNSNLDSGGEARLAECLKSLRQAGSTVVVVSHRSGILFLMDKILCLQEGRAVGFGPRDEVMSRLSQLAQAGAARAAGGRDG